MPTRTHPDAVRPAGTTSTLRTLAASHAAPEPSPIALSPSPFLGKASDPPSRMAGRQIATIAGPFPSGWHRAHLRDPPWAGQRTDFRLLQCGDTRRHRRQLAVSRSVDVPVSSVAGPTAELRQEWMWHHEATTTRRNSVDAISCRTALPLPHPLNKLSKSGPWSWHSSALHSQQ